MDEFPEYCLRLCNEPEKYYNSYKIFLELGNNRTLSQVAELTGISLPRIKRASSKWDWIFRANKYDDWVLDQVRNEVRKSIDDDSIFQFEQKMKLADLSQKLILSLIENLNNCPTLYDKPEIMKRTKYIKSIASTIIDLQKIFHFTINTDLMYSKLKSDLSDIDSLKKPQNNNQSSFDEELNLLNRLLSGCTKYL
jgi:hypothetical protein